MYGLPEDKPKISNKIKRITQREFLISELTDMILNDKGQNVDLIKRYKKLRLLNTGELTLGRRKRLDYAMKVICDGIEELQK